MWTAETKVDYGTIQSNNYDGVDRVSYSSVNVKDVMANLTLYEEGSVKDGADFDGSTGKVVDYKEGSISVENGYYRIGAEDAANPGTDEHIYYIETPTYVLLQDKVTKNPIGYRIIGANIEYKYGPTNQYGTKSQTYNTFFISQEGWSTYFLNATGGATTSQNERAMWFIDEEGYIRTGVNGQTYLSSDNSRYASVTTNKENAVKCTIDDNGRIKTGNYYLVRERSWGSSYFRWADSYSDRATRTPSGTTTVNIDGVIGTTTQSYKLKVYDKTGTTAQEVTVNSTNASGNVPVVGMNNDALKIGVVGTGLIKGSLILQAIDPYLEKMDVVCTDKANEKIRMHQTFTASDFSVSGGEFYFYVPAGTENVAITFENLKSKYFDETYDGGSTSHTSRINFVKSAHYNKFGASNNNVYNDKPEAAADKASVSERLKVSIVGDKKFKFNNAEDLAEDEGILTEYPFTLEKYADAPNEGSFDVMEYEVTTEDNVATKYVFTTDETRYNIAPTTAVQHRAYAYYEMIVHVQSAHYQPVVEFKKVYDQTLYRDKDNNQVKKDAFYGVKVTAPYTQGGVTKQGYASTADIFKIIDGAMKGNAAAGTVTETDEETEEVTTIGTYSGKDAKLTSAKQILYLDMSQLAGIYQITTDANPDMSSYSASNAANCMFFLPKGSSAPNDNVAYMMESGEFMSANNIVLTDKQPFYSPYKINMLSTNTITYKRQVTIDQYGKVQNASLILPFVINVTNGKHVNLDDTEFTLHSMQANGALTHNLNQNDYAYFPKLEEGVTATKANTPYLVQLTEKSTEDNVSFVVSQKGTTIEPTTSMAADYTFTGASSTGIAIKDTPDGQFTGTYTFTPVGSYSGQSVPKTQNIFYFANDEFVNSADYVAGSEIRVVPFRAYYNTSKKGNAKLMRFGIIFDEGEGNEATGISNVNSNPDLMVVPGNGAITFTSSIEQNVRVTSVSGVLVENAKLQAGETRTISVPAGMYVINGVKIIVK